MPSVICPQAQAWHLEALAASVRSRWPLHGSRSQGGSDHDVGCNAGALGREGQEVRTLVVLISRDDVLFRIGMPPCLAAQAYLLVTQSLVASDARALGAHTQTWSLWVPSCLSYCLLVLGGGTSALRGRRAAPYVGQVRALAGLLGGRHAGGSVEAGRARSCSQGQICLNWQPVASQKVWPSLRPWRCA